MRFTAFSNRKGTKTMFERLDESNKLCLALLRTILLNCRFALNRQAGYVNIFMPLEKDGKKATLALTMTTDRFWSILEYLNLSIREDHIERKSQA